MGHPYADFIDQVSKPARYLGGEYKSVVKDHSQVDGTLCLAFPDVYEIGMSHMGTKIIYTQLNRNPRLAAERCFTPWVDLEAELRTRSLPLVSLETSTPLSEFDVVGISLQYELTFSNVLTLLDLGGIPLRAANRTTAHPLVIGGGPVATHPEPMAPFFDAFYIGEAEEELEGLVLAWGLMRKQGRERLDALAELAATYPIYVPALYATDIDEDTGMVVVGEPTDPRVPARVRRAVVGNLDDYPFPSDAPVPYAEAVFDRAGVEIARGCTEGCRFCQAGMIYRPVRERSPESIIETITKGVDGSGYDETSLTCLSTADYSAISPLVKKVMGALRDKKVTLSVSSLRAYGLTEEILDELASMRVTGLTFAPEAGTQRMRDVVNKNVAESHIEESTHRVFERGWHRLKLYFMIGLPTEEDEDVCGIVETGERMLRIGRQYAGKRAEMTVSVSSHVPKPHTPFQWCAQDAIDEIKRKQALLRHNVRSRSLRLKYHDRGISFLEGILSRGDRRLGDVIEQAWKQGARFDGWDELFDVDRWRRVMDEHGVDTDAYLGTRPITARLPWDHIDVGLEEGFLLTEYRKALKSRLSPPCGKVVGQLVHHTNLSDANQDQRRLVCYDCGVACDLSEMREDRLVKLTTLGAEEPTPPSATRSRADAVGGYKKKPKPTPAFADRPSQKFRVRYTKLGRVAFLGHLDTARVLARIFRRAGLVVGYSRGFHPKPRFHFGPALSLGVPSFGEFFDVELENAPSAAEVRRRLAEVSPEGIEITGTWLVPELARSLSKNIATYDLLVAPAPDGLVWDAGRVERVAAEFMAKGTVTVARKDREVDVRGFVQSIEVVDSTQAARLEAALSWPRSAALFVARVEVGPNGSAKPVEVAKAIGVWGREEPTAPHAKVARLGFAGVVDGELLADAVAARGGVGTVGHAVPLG